MATISLSIKTPTEQQMLAAAVGPKSEYVDGKSTGAQATDRQSGLPLWRVSVFMLDADTTRAPEQISVTVPAPVAPALPQLAPVVFTGLRVLIWAGGASLRADSVELASPQSAASSSFLSDIDVAGGE